MQPPEICSFAEFAMMKEKAILLGRYAGNNESTSEAHNAYFETRNNEHVRLVVGIGQRTLCKTILDILDDELQATGLEIHVEDDPKDITLVTIASRPRELVGVDGRPLLATGKQGFVVARSGDTNLGIDWDAFSQDIFNDSLINA